MRKLVDQAKARDVSHLITWRPYRKDPEEQECLKWRALKQPKTAWRNAMDIIEERFGRRYRWHDIRAAFISHVALKSGGVIAKELARHSYYRTTKAYILVSEEVQRAAARDVAQRPVLVALTGKSHTEVSHAQRHKRGRSRQVLDSNGAACVTRTRDPRITNWLPILNLVQHISTHFNRKLNHYRRLGSALLNSAHQGHLPFIGWFCDPSEALQRP